MKEFVDNGKDNRMGCGDDHLGTTWRQREEDARSQDEKEECGCQQIGIAHFIKSREIP